MDKIKDRKAAISARVKEHYDYLVLMDRNNMSNMIRMFGAENMNKVSMLLDRDVADPWYTGNFDVTYDDVLRGCTGLLQAILDDAR